MISENNKLVEPAEILLKKCICHIQHIVKPSIWTNAKSFSLFSFKSIKKRGYIVYNMCSLLIHPLLLLLASGMNHPLYLIFIEFTGDPLVQ